MAYDGRLLRLAQERYEADRSAREADLAEQREQLYARRPRLREIQDQLRRTASRVMAACSAASLFSVSPSARHSSRGPQSGQATGWA